MAVLRKMFNLIYILFLFKDEKLKRHVSGLSRLTEWVHEKAIIDTGIFFPEGVNLNNISNELVKTLFQTNIQVDTNMSTKAI